MLDTIAIVCNILMLTICLTIDVFKERSRIVSLLTVVQTCSPSCQECCGDRQAAVRCECLGGVGQSHWWPLCRAAALCEASTAVFLSSALCCECQCGRGSWEKCGSHFKIHGMCDCSTLNDTLWRSKKKCYNHAEIQRELFIQLDYANPHFV